MGLIVWRNYWVCFFIDDFVKCEGVGNVRGGFWVVWFDRFVVFVWVNYGRVFVVLDRVIIYVFGMCVS